MFVHNSTQAGQTSPELSPNNSTPTTERIRQSRCHFLLGTRIQNAIHNRNASCLSPFWLSLPHMVQESIKANDKINMTSSEADAAAAAVLSKKKLTKRQKRKQPNEKNKWPQHPKIQSMGVRSKAYIRVAGLGTSTRAKEPIDPKLDLMSPEVKFGRLLGGTDQRKRHAGVNKLKAYLKARCDINNDNGGISEMDLLKLWKGLWYTLYMADKVPVQDELSKRLAELLWCVAGTLEEDEYAGQAYMDMCDEQEAESEEYDDEDVTMEEIANTLHEEIGEEDSAEEEEAGSNEDEEEVEEDEHAHDEHCNHGDEEEYEELEDFEIPHCRGAHLASLFIRTFFRTIRREWGQMDKYRVDKFYTLTRLYMQEIFTYMATRHWNLGIIRLFNDALFEEVLNQVPNGLRYHLIDIALEELAKANSKAPMPLTEATFLDTLEPYFAMCQTGARDPTVQARVIEKVLEKFIDKYSVVSEQEEKEENEDAEESLVFDQVHVGSVAQFIFELASDPETKDQYRKSLYDMHKKYMRQLKKAGTDVELNEEQVPLDDEEQDWPEGDVDAEDEMEGQRQEDAGSEDEMEEESKEEEEEQPPPTKALKKKRKHDDPVEDEPSGSAKGEKKKKKRKGVKKDTSNETAPDAADDEEVLTISLSEQKNAKAEEKKKRKKKSEAEPYSKGKSKQKADSKGKSKQRGGSKGKSEQTAEAEDKRVKWEAVNRSKSYKASMKALVTYSPPKDSTPEKSILLNKGKIRRANVTKKAGRKRAVNYF